MAIIPVGGAFVQFHGKLRAFERGELAMSSGTGSVVPNGVRANTLDVRWVKSSHSNAEGNCVEVAALVGGGVAVRNSRDPEGPALVYTPDELAAFLAGAKDGEFDHLV